MVPLKGYCNLYCRLSQFATKTFVLTNENVFMKNCRKVRTINKLYNCIFHCSLCFFRAALYMLVFSLRNGSFTLVTFVSKTIGDSDTWQWHVTVTLGSATRYRNNPGRTKANGREPKSCLGRVFNFKLGPFVMYVIAWHIQKHALP